MISTHRDSVSCGEVLAAARGLINASVDWFIGTLVHVAMFPKILTMLNYILQSTQYKSNWRQNDFSLS